MGRPLHPDVALGVRISAILSRNRYTRKPGPVIDELCKTAGERLDILSMEAGSWVGYYRNEHYVVLAEALLAAFPDAQRWVPLGEERRGAGSHGTDGFGSPTR